MIKIAFFCSKDHVSNQFLYAVKKLSGYSLSDIKNKIENNESFLTLPLPIDLFDDEEYEKKIRDFIDLTKALSVPCRMYSIYNDDTLSKNETENKELYISENNLNNLINARKERLENDESWEALCEDD